MPDLLIGCGNSRDRRFNLSDRSEWRDLVTLDHDPRCHPDVQHDLEQLPLPFPSDHFHEIHAYEVLEHVGQQGDFKAFFALFSEFWRILKPGGHLVGTVPVAAHPQAWGDPGHRRMLTEQTFAFLSQAEYQRQVGTTCMTDYRNWYQADFDSGCLQHRDGETAQLNFILKAIKPSRFTDPTKSPQVSAATVIPFNDPNGVGAHEDSDQPGGGSCPIPSAGPVHNRKERLVIGVMTAMGLSIGHTRNAFRSVKRALW